MFTYCSLYALVTMFQRDYIFVSWKQGDPTAMVVYWIGLTLFLKQIVTCYLERDPKMVVFADDLSRPER